MGGSPCTVVIFGATGDLTKRKLIPALYALHCKGNLHKNTKIIAIGRRAYSDSQIRTELSEFITDKKKWNSFANRITYHLLEFDDISAYKVLKTKLAKNDPHRIFYLATPPDAFPIIIEHLSKTGVAAKK